MKSNYAVSVLMSSTSGVVTHVICVYYDVTEAEAKGKAVVNSLEANSGFSIASVVSLEIRCAGGSE